MAGNFSSNRYFPTTHLHVLHDQLHHIVSVHLPSYPPHQSGIKGLVQNTIVLRIHISVYYKYTVLYTIDYAHYVLNVHPLNLYVHSIYMHGLGAEV